MSETWIRNRVLGARLWRAREAAKLTQEQVAAEFGCHQSVISRIELGDRAVRAEELFTFARLYGQSVEALGGPFSEEEEKLQSGLKVNTRLDSPLLPRRSWRRN